MFCDYLTATLDIGLNLGTAAIDNLLTPLHVIAELLLARLYVVVDLSSRGFRFLLQVFCFFASTLGESFPSLAPRLRGVKHTDCRADSEPNQKPTESTAASAIIFV